jgi:hypothetical protein
MKNFGDQMVVDGIITTYPNFSPFFAMIHECVESCSYLSHEYPTEFRDDRKQSHVPSFPPKKGSLGICFPFFITLIWIMSTTPSNSNNGNGPDLLDDNPNINNNFQNNDSTYPTNNFSIDDSDHDDDHEGDAVNDNNNEDTDRFLDEEEENDDNNNNVRTNREVDGGESTAETVPITNTSPRRTYDEESGSSTPSTRHKQPRDGSSNSHRRRNENDKDNAGYYDQGVKDSDAPEPPRRQFKYSTADLKSTSNWKKFCYIFLLFALFFAVMIGFSMMMNHFFFSTPEDTAANNEIPERDPNATAFPEEAFAVNGACSTTSLSFDDGATCSGVCNPQYLDCCDPFHTFGNSEGQQQADTDVVATPAPSPSAFFHDPNYSTNGTCSLSTELRGCVAYAKCAALGKIVDPAPAILPIVCSADEIIRDPVTCNDLCAKVQCCYSNVDGSNCVAANFDICLDYAPCQNLRTDVLFKVETAPAELDQDCFLELASCYDDCAAGACCGDESSLCFRNNFISCLTYAPCNNLTDTDIVVAPKYSVVNEPPQPALRQACQYYASDEAGGGGSNDKTSCIQLCQEMSCCADTDAATNCFFRDPLGCLEWEIQCQMRNVQ